MTNEDTIMLTDDFLKEAISQGYMADAETIDVLDVLATAGLRIVPDFEGEVSKAYQSMLIIDGGGSD